MPETLAVWRGWRAGAGDDEHNVSRRRLPPRTPEGKCGKEAAERQTATDSDPRDRPAGQSVAQGARGAHSAVAGHADSRHRPPGLGDVRCAAGLAALEGGAAQELRTFDPSASAGARPSGGQPALPLTASGPQTPPLARLGRRPVGAGGQAQ